MLCIKGIQNRLAKMNTPKPTIGPLMSQKLSQNNLKMDQGPGPNLTMVHNVHLEMPRPPKSQKSKKSAKASLFGNLFGERPQPKIINKARDLLRYGLDTSLNLIS
jgi:hypothetical protein